MEKRLLQPFNMFILNLAVTDFSVAITAMTFYTLDTLLGYWPFGTIMCGVWIYFDFAMTFASVFTLVAISVDRFWCVTWAIHYRMHNNKNKTAFVIGIIWFLVVAIWTPPFIGDRLKHSEPHSCIWEPNDNTEFVIFVAVIGHYIPCAIMVFCYIKVFMVMRRQSSLVTSSAQGGAASSVRVNVQAISYNMSGNTSKTSNVYVGNTHLNDQLAANETSNGRYLTPTTSLSIVGNQNSPPSRSPSQADDTDAPSNQTHSVNRAYRVSNSQQREKRIFITLTYVLFSYLICWFPFYIAFDTYAWKPDLVPAGLYSFFFWSTYVNSTLNPFIYAFTNKEFRLAFIKVLRRICGFSKNRETA
ncbi:alpha-2A adrenergic receptor-like [Ruditapes philippinarum]|uniref:alpha-2A adrenergic receptor-like n=1 Tax=Ruditapes philippinarum TaxID=129788 RepID=UPI00295BE59D|nr:alpha-2A adrenergic receptor-like [Ruditapes philippinarum]